MSPATTDAAHVTVRMYNVGFGDAFLLLFPGAERPCRVLVDCGSHFLGAGPRPIAAVVEDILADVTDADGVARIDLVVGTHRHQDHVSGFEGLQWAGVEVGEVWMPWTEHPTDPEARQIRDRQSSTAKRLVRGLRVLGVQDADDHPAMRLALNALTNAKAMDTLHRGFAGRPRRRFLPGRPHSRRTFRLPAAPGMRIHVLGPSRVRDVIRDMDPPAGESYLWLASTGAGRDADRPAPFTADWELAPDAFEARYPGLALSAADRDLIGEFGAIDPFALAVALERAVNGTSLVLMFEMGDAFLLFPGDAQWGTWRAMLDDRDDFSLLMRTTFLKVGHHGSHNATPVDFVEAVMAARGDEPDPRDLWAMVSTRHVEMWHEIPKTELLTALGGLTARLARSDKGAEPPTEGFSHWDTRFIEAVVPLA